MTRINTNISSLTAQNALQRSNDDLQTALTRLSTGLRINVGKDDPAGLIASEALKSDITSVTKAISNSERANEMIATADSALGQVSDLLNDIRGLVTEAANTGAMSDDQIAANQLQVDSSLDAINRISQVTSFQGRRLLDGSLDFITENWTNDTRVTDLQINSAQLGTTETLAVDVNVTTAATQGVLEVAIADAGSTSATSRAYTADGGTLTVTAPNTGSTYNGVTVKFATSADVSAADPSAAYNSSSKELVITVNDSEATTLAAIETAIETDTSFTATSTAGKYFDPLTDSANSAKSTGTITFADGTVISLEAKTASALYNSSIAFVETGSGGTPTITWDSASKVQTVEVDITGGTNTAQAFVDSFNSDGDSQFYATLVTDGGTGYSTTNDSPLGSAAVQSYADFAFTNGDVSVKAVVPGTGGDGITIAYTNGGAGTGASAVWTNATTLTVTMYASTTLGEVADAITTTGAAGGSVAIFATTNDSAGLVAADDPADQITANGAAAVHAANTATSGGFTGMTSRASALFSFATNSGNLLVRAASTGSAGDAYSIAFATGGAAGTASAVWTSATLLTVTANATASMSTIADAINTTAAGTLEATTNTPAALTGGDVPTTQTLSGGAGMAGGTTSGGLAADLVFQLSGTSGTQVFSFDSGTTGDVIEAAIDLVKDATGVDATWDVGTHTLSFASTAYGTDAYVAIEVVSEGAGGTFKSGLQNSSGVAATRSEGTDVVATVNGMNATGKANTLSINNSTLSMSMTVIANTPGHITFDITGGGAEFQLGPDVVSNQQARIGIGSVNAATLSGVSGRLYTIGSGEENALATDPTTAATIVDEVITKVTSLRGRLGAFQKATLESNIASLTDTQENLTSAQSNIRDADFAAESANLTRAQILVQSGTSVLSIANQNPQNVLSLLR